MDAVYEAYLRLLGSLAVWGDLLWFALRNDSSPVGFKDPYNYLLCRPPAYRIFSVRQA